ncbi:protein of unknown function (plasmid) [Methylocella tundrae]|uniref:Uncharacterized protein n=1 Tax=Methylocella tundrae TaxID=227605 RepID=A0A4U8Z7D7_METTU|nr:protein of unknown function [Methylocella tundrae]
MRKTTDAVMSVVACLSFGSASPETQRDGNAPKAPQRGVLQDKAVGPPRQDGRGIHGAVDLKGQTL